MLLLFYKIFSTNYIVIIIVIIVSQSEADYVQAISDYSSREATTLCLRKGDIIKIVKNKNLRIAKGN